MTTKYITTTYTNGYTLAPAYSGLDIEASGSIGYGLTLTGSQAVTIVNDGSVSGAPGGNYDHNGVTGVGGVGLTLAGTATLGGSGAIVGGNGGDGYYPSSNGAGGAGAALAALASLTNSGTILGGAGGVAIYGGAGGAGVTLAAGAELLNAGIVTGGAGGEGLIIGRSGTGGTGVALSVGARLGNSGIVMGGAGGPGNAEFSGRGGSGASLASYAGLTNTGTIEGGNGGVGFTPGAGGVGVYLGFGASLTNSGTITGGAGGGLPALAGDGVDVDGGTVINGSASYGAALISGDIGVSLSGAGTVTNFGTIEGTSGDSVVLSSAADRLIAEEGAAFIGAVEGGGGALQLAGGSGTITGLGGSATISGALAMNFSGFGRYALSPGGAWTLAGANTLTSGQTLFNNATLDGSGALDTNGQMTNGRSGVVDADRGALTIDETGASTIQNRALLEATNGGALLIEATVLKNTGTIAALGGDVTVSAQVKDDGTALINAGTLAFKARFGEDVTFAATTGELALADAVDYHGTISGFSSGGTSLDLGDIGFVDASEATFKGTGTGGVLTVTDGSRTAKIKMTGDYLGSIFTAQSDGNGGVIVVESGPGSAPPATTTPSPHVFISAMAAMAPGHAAVSAFDHGFREAMPALLGPRVKIA